MSALFKTLLFKHFPQLKKTLHDQQVQHLWQLASHITHQQEDEKIWATLENDIVLLHLFHLVVHNVLPPIRTSYRAEIVLGATFLGMMTLLFLGLFWKEALPDSSMQVLSFTLGILGTCLKDSFLRYFSTVVVPEKKDADFIAP